MRALFAFAPLYGKLKGAMLLTLVLSLAALATGIALLGLSGWFLTAAALSTAGAAFNLFAPSAGVRGLSFLRILSRYAEKLTGHDATLRLLSDLRRWLFTRLFPLVPFGKQFARGDLVSRLLADVDALDNMFLVALGPISTAVLAGIGMTVLLGFLMPAAAPVYAAAYFIAVLAVPPGLILATRRAGNEAMEASQALRNATLEGIDGHQDRLLFGAVSETFTTTRDAAARFAASRRRLGTMSAVAGGTVQLLAGVALIGALAAGLAALRANQIDGPLLAGLLLAVLASFEASAILVRSSGRLAAAAAAASRLDAVANSTPAIAEPFRPIALPDGPGELAFSNVSFGYDVRQPVLDGLNLVIPPGECLAVIGPSGSGKSTLAHLLLRLIDPQSGTIRLDGCDIRTVASHDLHHHIALMTQDAPVFLDSIRANLLIGNPAATDADLWRVLDDVKLGDVVRNLPGGLDSITGEAGRTLSAGQARRLCLARTLLSPARVLVLDEPTSGLDAETEAQFFADLPAQLHGRTAIVITHASVRGFDRVLTLRAGKLEERRGATT